MNQPLIDYIKIRIIPQYANFDKAHNLVHVRMVIEESLLLAEEYLVDKNMVYAIAAYHDLGLCEGRETHHLASGRILKEDAILAQWFTSDEIQIMKEAVEDHRASSTSEPRSIYGKIVAEADRIIDPELTLRRTVQYGLKSRPNLTREWHYMRFQKHLMEKYAEGGYLKLWFEKSKNKENLEKLRKLLNDEGQLMKIFDRLFEEESRQIKKKQAR